MIRAFKRFIDSFRLALLFSAIVLGMLTASLAIVFLGMMVLYYSGIIKSHSPRGIPSFFIFGICCIISGTILFFLTSKKFLHPVQEIINAIKRVADGDYTVRLHLTKLKVLQELSISFNHMVEELGSVELLRTDFINNFSHEFKTPIVSISGFAGMLKNDSLTEQERNEYLDIIINESARLTQLSTNVLNLSKLEKQSILIDQSVFDVMEQIRLVIAMMDGKWQEKQINFTMSEDRCLIRASEAMLKQVWINLLDNAIKFSPVNGNITIQLTKADHQLFLRFIDEGPGIPPDAQGHIFDKFYQGDTSHSGQGNGLGLTIAKRALTLHNGSITIEESNNQGTTFLVTLPQYK